VIFACAACVETRSVACVETRGVACVETRSVACAETRSVETKSACVACVETRSGLTHLYCSATYAAPQGGAVALTSAMLMMDKAIAGKLKQAVLLICMRGALMRPHNLHSVGGTASNAGEIHCNCNGND
jgi:hypothetical protein